MTTPDFNVTISVDQTPNAVFNAIKNIRGWWSKNIEGSTARLNDEFTYRFEDMHRCTLKLIEMVPDKKVVWLVLDNYFSFTKDKKEWTGTTLEFEIAEKKSKTQVHFTHRGLVPAYECYDICQDAWSGYIKNSLRGLITTGKGQPNPREEVRS
jgi:activator of Hsp90 ATPase-like protein